MDRLQARSQESGLQMMGPPSREDRGTAVGEYLAILYRRRYLAGLVLLATMVTVVYYTLRIPTLYRASATVLVERIDIGLTDLLTRTGANQLIVMETLTEILKSRSVAEKAAVRAGMDGSQADLVRRSVTVATIRNTTMIAVTGTSVDPVEAARLTNAVAEEFSAVSLESRKRQAVLARKFLDEAVAATGRELRRAEEALVDFKMRERNVALKPDLAIKASRVAELEGARAAVQTDRRVLETRVQEIRRRLSQAPELSPSTFAPSPLVRTLRDQLAMLEIELAGLTERFTDRHPAVIATKAQIQGVRSKLQQAMSASLEPSGYVRDPTRSMLLSELIIREIEMISLKAREEALAQAIRESIAEVGKLPPRELELLTLERDAKIAERTYLLLSEKFQEARIVEASITPDISVVDRAMVPRSPVSPNRSRNLLFGAVLGAFLAFGAALGADIVDRSIRTAEEAEHLTGLPVLATIPAVFRRSNREGPEEFVTRDGIPIAVHSSRSSVFAEAFRSLRTSMMFSSPDKPLKTVMVTSALPDEGKTTIAVNLASSLALTGRKVLLVEADLRNPAQLAGVFHAQDGVGLTDYLIDAISLEHAVKRAEVENIDYISAGSTPPNPAELVGSQRMRAFLGKARETADVVLCDSAPVIPVADSIVLAAEVDGVILVVEAGRTPRDALQLAQKKLVASGAHIVGLVLTKLRVDSRGLYYGYYAYRS